jgi:hypothetical protein
LPESADQRSRQDTLDRLLASLEDSITTSEQAQQPQRALVLDDDAKPRRGKERAVFNQSGGSKDAMDEDEELVSRKAKPKPTEIQGGEAKRARKAPSKAAWSEEPDAKISSSVAPIAESDFAAPLPPSAALTLPPADTFPPPPPSAAASLSLPPPPPSAAPSASLPPPPPGAAASVSPSSKSSRAGPTLALSKKTSQSLPISSGDILPSHHSARVALPLAPSQQPTKRASASAPVQISEASASAMRSSQLVSLESVDDDGLPSIRKRSLMDDIPESAASAVDISDLGLAAASSSSAASAAFARSLISPAAEERESIVDDEIDSRRSEPNLDDSEYAATEPLTYSTLWDLRSADLCNSALEQRAVRLCHD